MAAAPMTQFQGIVPDMMQAMQQANMPAGDMMQKDMPKQKAMPKKKKRKTIANG